ncbi:MAG: hypothetical protein JSV67_00570 [Thermoplasmatales archaeon]|nr:MAG: hypothetical protein JSV67_00570 [Thermoplasmatales archaeon]
MKKTKTNKKTPTGEKTQGTKTKNNVTSDLQEIIKKRNDKKTITLSFEELKPYIDKSYIKTKISKLGETIIYVDDTIVYYIAQRKYGLAFQTIKDDSWKTTRITTKEQLQRKFDAMEKLHNANKSVKQALDEIVD